MILNLISRFEVIKSCSLKVMHALLYERYARPCRIRSDTEKVCAASANHENIQVRLRLDSTKLQIFQ